MRGGLLPSGRPMCHPLNSGVHAGAWQHRGPAQLACQRMALHQVSVRSAAPGHQGRVMPPFLYFFLSRRQNIKIVHRRPGRVARLVAPDPRLAGAKQLADARADGAGERRRRVAEGLEGCPARAHRAARQHAPLQALGLGRAVQSAAWMLSVRDPQHAVAMGHALLAGPACALSAASAHTRCSQAPLPLEVPAPASSL